MSPDTDPASAGAPGDWVCTCTEGLEEVTLGEVTQLGGIARILGDGLVTASASSLPLDAALQVRSHDTVGILVGTLRLTGNAAPDLEMFKTLCHPKTGAWGVGAQARWDAAAVAWVRARRAALQHGLGLGPEKEGTSPEADMAWDAADAKEVYARLGLTPGGGGSGSARAGGGDSSGDGGEGADSNGEGSGNGGGGESINGSGSDGSSGSGSCGGKGGGGGNSSVSNATAKGGVPMSFRVSCVRSPGSAGGGIKHGYTSVHVNTELGFSLGATHPTWRVDLARATLTVEVVVRGRFAVVTLQVRAGGSSHSLLLTLLLVATRFPSHKARMRTAYCSS
jgi:hypothetical protein